jgi:IS1 family transposase
MLSTSATVPRRVLSGSWVWVALDRHTRQVVACCLGERREESCRLLWEQVPAPWRAVTR